jgi:hypothetical protein
MFSFFVLLNVVLKFLSRQAGSRDPGENIRDARTGKRRRLQCNKMSGICSGCGGPRLPIWFDRRNSARPDNRKAGRSATADMFSTSLY